MGAGIEARLWHRSVRVQKEGVDGECFIFSGPIIGRKRPEGHGEYRGIRLDGGGPYMKAHKAAYLHFVGPIPDGWHLHHLCDTKECWNPAHLVPMSASAHSLLHHSEERTQCKHGHPFTPENTRLYTGPGDTKPTKYCRICARASKKRSRRKASNA